VAKKNWKLFLFFQPAFFLHVELIRILQAIAAGEESGKRKKQEKKAIVRNVASTHVTQRIASFCLTAVVITIIRYVAV
jgi:hypothetical protein